MTDPGIVIPIVSLVALAGIASVAAMRRAGGPPARSEVKSRDDSLAKLDERIARLEHAVDVIAVEMERVGEGQRFLTKVLVEREAKQG
ncbi:MAG: hypothetical protein ACHQWU_07005 [Gemmatimonadales bacterium]|jgi:hypothetical protein